MRYTLGCHLKFTKMGNSRSSKSRSDSTTSFGDSNQICLQGDANLIINMDDVSVQTDKIELFERCSQTDAYMYCLCDIQSKLDKNITIDISTRTQGVGLTGTTSCPIHVLKGSPSEETHVKTIEDSNRSGLLSTSEAEGTSPRQVPNNNTASTEEGFNQEEQATGTSEEGNNDFSNLRWTSAEGSSNQSSFNIRRISKSNVYFQAGVTNINMQTNCEETIVCLKWAEKEMDKKEKWLEKEIARKEKEKQELQQKYYQLQKEMSEQQQKLATERQAALQTEIDQLRQQTLSHIQSSQIPHNAEERRQDRPFSITVQGTNIIPNTAAISSIAETLYQNHQVRLLGMEGGTTFILDSPEVQFSEIIRRQAEIQAILAALLPQPSSGEVVWGCPTQEDIDLHVDRLTEALAQIERAGTFEESEMEVPETNSIVQHEDPVGLRHVTGQLIRFDPMTATPIEDIVIKTRSQQEKHGSYIIITCMVTSMSDEKLYMADRWNKSIKVCSLMSGDLISTISLDMTPVTITLVNENLLAVSTEECLIFLIDFKNSKTPVQIKSLETVRRYYGITVDRSHSSDPLLLVSTSDVPASVDIITLTGNYVKTLVSTQTLPTLKSPLFLHAA